MLLLAACTTDRSGQPMDGPRRADAPPIPLPPDGGAKDAGDRGDGRGAATGGSRRPDAPPVRPDAGPRHDGAPGSVDGGPPTVTSCAGAW